MVTTSVYNMKVYRVVGIVIALVGLFMSAVPAFAAAPHVFVFGRQNCEYCAAERTWLDNAGIPYTYYDVVPGTAASSTFDALATQHAFTNVTPITVIGSDVFQGFDGATTTGAAIISALQAERDTPYVTIADHLAHAPHTATIVAGAGCDQNGATCSIQNTNAHLINLPFYGLADASFFSLWQLAPVLGLLSLSSWTLLWFGLVLSGLLFLAPERQIFQRRLGIVLLVEALTALFLFSQPTGSIPVALIAARAQLVVAVVGVLVAGLYLYPYRRVRQVGLITPGSTFDLIAVLLLRLTLVLAAVTVPLVAMVAPAAQMETFQQVIASAPIDFFAYWWYSSLFILCFILPQVILVGLLLVLWHRFILPTERRHRFFPAVAAAVVLLGSAILVGWR